MAPAALDDDHHSMSSKTVCVMDASGHLGSTLAQRLVHRGYTVHAALQSHGGFIASYHQFLGSNMLDHFVFLISFV